MGDQSKINISLPYLERAALALVDRISERSIEANVFCVGSAAARRRIPSAHNISIVHLPNFINLPRKIIAKFATPRLDLRVMHLTKIVHDKVVARKIAGENGPLIGFPGACLNSFSRHRGIRVLHYVDSHPDYHNSVLQASLGAAARHELYPNWLVQRIKKEIELADILLVPSQMVADQMRTLGIASEKILIRPYGVDFDLFAPQVEGIRQGRDTRQTHAYVGQIRSLKGIASLLRVARELEFHNFMLIGNAFDEELLEDLPENVTYFPAVSHPELKALLSQADSLILPTVLDACSLVVMEAASMGLQIVTTDRNGAAELIVDLPQARIVSSGNDTLLNEAITSLDILDHESRRLNREESMLKISSWQVYADNVLAQLTERS